MLHTPVSEETDRLINTDEEVLSAESADGCPKCARRNMHAPAAEVAGVFSFKLFRGDARH